MTAAPEVRGWCPGALRPMLSGDGWIVRIRPPEGRLTPAQVTELADLADIHGNGFLQVTNRANLQLRGIRHDDVAPLVNALAKTGLVDPALAPEAEARLNILVNPYWDAPAPNAPRIDTIALWHRLRDALVAPDAPPLPGKFGFALDTGPQGGQLGQDSADIRIERAGEHLSVRADGLPTGRAVRDEAEAAFVAMAMARWFVASDGIGADGRGRMRDHLRRGALLPADLHGDAVPIAPAGHHTRHNLVTPAFGLIAARTFRTLGRHAPQGLRLTPWRGFHLPTLLHPAGLRRARTLILDPDDPRLRVTTCAGAPFCPQGRGHTRHVANVLTPALPPGATLHVSGCAKGCAHAGVATVTLVAQDGDRYGVIHNGTAADPPDCLVAEGDLPALMTSLAPDAPHL